MALIRFASKMDFTDIVNLRSNTSVQPYMEYSKLVSDVRRAKSACASDVVSLACLVSALAHAADSWAIKKFGHVAQARTTNKFVAQMLSGTAGPAVSSSHVTAFSSHRDMLVELEKRIAAGNVPAWCMPKNIQYIHVGDFALLNTDDKIALLQSLPDSAVTRSAVAAAVAARKPSKLEENAVLRAKMMAKLGAIIDLVCSKVVLERDFDEGAVFASCAENFKNDLLEFVDIGIDD